MPTPHNYMSLAEAAALVGVHPRTLSRAIAKGLLPERRTSPTGHYRITQAQLDQYLTACARPLPDTTTSDYIQNQVHKKGRIL